MVKFDPLYFFPELFWDIVEVIEATCVLHHIYK